jgi:hypothetical protein
MDNAVNFCPRQPKHLLSALFNYDAVFDLMV